ncbi:SMI1/KNR4 family protein [Streptomyces sp. NPDC058614]|uniref:SMI1/KNR4 family protein n=1 Tax=Streptomyces sp. NPDC058614 TaxID=3346557 RepID=UPI0036506914
MPSSLEPFLGPPERFRPASTQAWRHVEDWLGRDLPADYKEFVDGYGDALLCGHLFVPHPEGSDPLLKFMQEERRIFQEAYGEVRNIPSALTDAWEEIVPWAYHDWSGDVCLFFSDPENGQWRVAVAFRQCPEFLLVEESFTDFMALLLSDRRTPRGWPVREPLWQSMPDSPLM